jgi:hypothetical protein
MKTTPQSSALNALADALRQRGVLEARRDQLSGWHWLARRRLAAQSRRCAITALWHAPAVLEGAREAQRRADTARSWGRTELGSPRQHVREAAAALLEAIGEPVTVPAGAQLLADLNDVLFDGRGSPSRAVAWDDIARALKELFPSRYPVLTGMLLRRSALQAGVAEQVVADGVSRRGAASRAAVAAALASRRGVTGS